eukprot:m.120641 g.120641  ORF g.120641 m.120641 type:complete len:709 (+) comp14559_c1_seq1:54-2180(+)
MLLSTLATFLLVSLAAAQTYHVQLPDTDLGVNTSLGLSIGDAAHALAGGLYSQLVFGESFEETTDSSLLPWSPFGSGVVSNNVKPFHGKRSASLTCNSTVVCPWCVAMGNRGLGGLGISVEANKTYSGFLYLRSDGAAHVTVGFFLGLKALCIDQFFLEGPTNWTLYKFSLSPMLATTSATFVISMIPNLSSKHSSSRHPQARAAAVAAAPDCSSSAPSSHRVMDSIPVTVGVDMVFVEPGAWGRFKGNSLRARKDVATRVATMDALRFGGDMVAQAAYKWEALRGPMQLRPPLFTDRFYPFQSASFALFEALQLAELAGTPGPVIIGLNPLVETIASLEAFVEYCWGPGSTPMGARRVSDGHANAYRTFWIELGPDATLSSSQYIAFFSKATKAMQARLAALAPSLVPQVKFVLSTSQLSNFSSSDITTLQALCTSLHNACVAGLVSLGANTIEEFDALSSSLSQLQTRLALPLALLHVQPVSSDGRTHARALLNAHIADYALHAGIVAVFFGQWAAAACEVDGSPCPPAAAPARFSSNVTSLQAIPNNNSLTEIIEILPDTIYVQPPWYPTALLVARLAAGPALAAVPSGSDRVTVLSRVQRSVTGSGQTLCNVTITLFNPTSSPATPTIAFDNAWAVTSGSSSSRVIQTQLACSPDAINTPSNHTACQPGPATTVHFSSPSLLPLTLAPFSFSLVTVDGLACISR